MTPKGEDFLAAGTGAEKAFLSRIPGFAEFFGAREGYQESVFRREVRQFMSDLNVVLGKRHFEIDARWLETKEGQQFAHKVFACGIDAQLSDKKELFAAALVAGAASDRVDPLEKLMFVDILRRISRASLEILAEMHKMFGSKARRPGTSTGEGEPFPLVNGKNIARELSNRFDPYMVEASVREMESLGLFSTTGAWEKQRNGFSSPSGGFATEFTYTDFSARFIEFVGLNPGGEIVGR